MDATSINSASSEIDRRTSCAGVGARARGETPRERDELAHANAGSSKLDERCVVLSSDAERSQDRGCAHGTEPSHGLAEQFAQHVQREMASAMNSRGRDEPPREAVRTRSALRHGGWMYRRSRRAGGACPEGRDRRAVHRARARDAVSRCHRDPSGRRAVGRAPHVLRRQGRPERQVTQVLYGTGTYTSDDAGRVDGQLLSAVHVHRRDGLAERVQHQLADHRPRLVHGSRSRSAPSSAHNGTTISDASVQAELAAQINSACCRLRTTTRSTWSTSPKGKTQHDPSGSQSCVSGGLLRLSRHVQDRLAERLLRRPARHDRLAARPDAAARRRSTTRPRSRRTS